MSVDENTGLQALERRYLSNPVRPGPVERIEFEYRRHGNLWLIANFDVVTGKIVSPTLGPTRTKADFAAHLVATVQADPEATGIFVADQLNNHLSATLVEWIAERCRIQEDLGFKGETGILQSKQSRREFLRDPPHRIRFDYTPRHCSWLNQVEIWFPILARRLLRRASFPLRDDLRTHVLDFISYFNEILCKPLRWTFTGRPLHV